MHRIFKKYAPVSAALLPNAEFDDIKLVLSMFLPWNWSKWRSGKEISELEEKFKEYFSVKHAFSFSSGRVGLYAILKSISIFLGSAFTVQRSEIIIQAYTTIAIPIAVKQAGFVPVYADIKEDTYNIDPVKVEEKITENTKAIIVQHTFGIPAEMDKITALCQKHNLLLIEDCAHSLGAEFGGKKTGTFGDAAFFSFGRDKIISSTSGGMAIVKDQILAEKIKKIQSNMDFPPLKWIFQQLAHPLVFWCSLPVYYFFSLGKIKILFWQKIGLISRAYSAEEKTGNAVDFYGYKFPNILAVLAFNQFKKMERFNDHRRKIAEIYGSSFKNHTEIIMPAISSAAKSTFLYYTIQVARRDKLLNFAAEKHIILGDWFPGALGPKGIEEEKFGYKKGDCQIAERVGLKSLDLPTNINTSEEDARKVADLIKEFFKS
ncbi:MAG: DegT/DnrJ/EryC1/StrS family aminotransferase [bacterium]|nr:DegT/DnrJ/EryC1/StrS family aminotransferase [bacterium]